MRLLVPTRVCLALRWATTPAASRAVTRAPKKKSKAAAALREKTAQPDAPPATSKAVKPTPKLSNREAELLREKTQQRDALVYLDAGKNEEFRAQWKGKLLTGDLSDNTTLHEALLKSAESGTSDPAMLRWYAESLDGERRTPIPTKLESLMVPVVRALAGKIEKWEENDKRKEKLRKWRDDYTDEALENLLDSMLDYMVILTERKKFTPFNLLLMEKALERVKRQERTVAVNWTDIVLNGATRIINFDDLLPHHSLVQVGREARSKDLKFRDFDSLHLRDENSRLMEEPSEMEGTRRFDGFCTLMLAVASRGHWLSNGTVSHGYTEKFRSFIEKNNGDSSQVNFLKNFAHDSVLRYSSFGVVQPAVDHSKAPQFIDQEKKELAFTVALDLKESRSISIEYYSLHLD